LSIFFSIKKLSKVDGNDDFVKRIHEKVEEVNRDTEVTEIMTIEEEMNIRWHYGYDEGEAAGAAQKQREIAKNMKEKNIPNADIAEITGLSAEEIEKL
jgi:predicted transposase/invertase (TIGR01784 family)